MTMQESLKKYEFARLIELSLNNNQKTQERALEIIEKLAKDKNFWKLVCSWDEQKEIISRKISVRGLLDSFRKAFDTPENKTGYTLKIELHHLASPVEEILNLLIYALAKKEAVLTKGDFIFSSKEAQEAYWTLQAKQLTKNIMATLLPMIKNKKNQHNIQITKIILNDKVRENF